VMLWNVATGEVVKVLKGHTRGVSRVEFSPDRKTLASASDDNTVKIWYLSTGETVKTFKGTQAFGHLAYSPDGRLLAAARSDGSLILWDMVSYEERARFKPNLLPRAPMLAFSPDGKSLATSSWGKDHAVRI